MNRKDRRARGPERRQIETQLELKMNQYCALVLYMAGSLIGCMQKLEGLDEEAKSIGYTPHVKVPPRLKEDAQMALTYVSEHEDPGTGGT